MSQFMLIMSQQILGVYNYGRAKVPSFTEQMRQLTIREQAWTTINCRSYYDNLTKIF